MARRGPARRGVDVRQRLTETHAQLIQDDALAVGRLARTGAMPGGQRSTFPVLVARVRAGWDAYLAMMAELA